MSVVNNTIELLQHEKILLAIQPHNQLQLTQLEIFPTIDSTNTYLLAQAKHLATSGRVCFAEEQTQGRGRQGRSWFSPPGANLYCSMLWQFDHPMHSGLSVAVAVMIAKALKKYGMTRDIQLKWPNDILFLQRKLAGILLESIGNKVVIGIGINLSLPPSVESNWISLSEIQNEAIARNHLAGLLINELLTGLQVFAKTGLTYFLDVWRQYDYLQNQTVILTWPLNTATGVMQGINARGELLLRDLQGHVKAFSYGEVSVKKI